MTSINTIKFHHFQIIKYENCLHIYKTIFAAYDKNSDFFKMPKKCFEKLFFRSSSNLNAWAQDISQKGNKFNIFSLKSK